MPHRPQARDSFVRAGGLKTILGGAAPQSHFDPRPGSRRSSPAGAREYRRPAPHGFDGASARRPQAVPVVKAQARCPRRWEMRCRRAMPEVCASKTARARSAKNRKRNRRAGEQINVEVTDKARGERCTTRQVPRCRRKPAAQRRWSLSGAVADCYAPAGRSGGKPPVPARP